MPSFKRDWAVALDLKKDTVDRMFVREDFLFVYTKAGVSYVIRRDRGTIEHSEVIPGGESRLHPPVLLKEFIVYPTTSELFCYNYGGQRVRTYDLKAAIRSDVVGERSSVYVPIDVGGFGPRLRKLDLNVQNDAPTWDLAPFRGSIAGAPAVHQDIVYMASDDGLIYAVSAESREPIWPVYNPPYGNTFDAHEPILADLKADDSGLYFVTGGVGRLYCLNRITGGVKWQFSARRRADSLPRPHLRHRLPARPQPRHAGDQQDRGPGDQEAAVQPREGPRRAVGADRRGAGAVAGR